MTEFNLRSRVCDLTSDLFEQGGFDSYDEAVYAVLVDVARAYLAARQSEPSQAFSMTDLWGTVQSLHENLESEARDWDRANKAVAVKVLPSRSIKGTIKYLMKNPAPRSTGESPSRGDLMSMADDGVLYSGLRFYDVLPRKGVVKFFEAVVSRYEDGKIKELGFRRVTEDGSPVTETFRSPSKASAVATGTVRNPYDTWRVEDGHTLRGLYVNWARSKSSARS